MFSDFTKQDDLNDQNPNIQILDGREASFDNMTQSIHTDDNSNQRAQETPGRALETHMSINPKD